MSKQAKTNSSSGMFQEIENYLYSFIPNASLLTDLEVLSYIYECIKYYGLEAITGDDSRGYTTTLKKGQLVKSTTARPPMPAYVLRRIVYFVLGQFTSLAFLQKISNLGINPNSLFDMFTTFVIGRQISWFSIISYFSTPYIVNGLVGPAILTTMRGYVNRDGVSSTVKYTYKALECTKVYYKGERKALIELMVQAVGKRLNGMIILEPIKIVKILARMIRASAQHLRTQTEVDKEVEMSYNVKEVDDFVMVEEKTHKEVMDKSGVLIVDV